MADALHELSAPVTVLAGHIDNARYSGNDRQRLHKSLAAMDEQCRRMRRLLDDLMRLAVPESAHEEPSRDQWVDVRTLLARIRDDTEALSERRHRVILDMQQGISLIGNVQEIACAFGNLARNAVRYTPSGGEVRLIWRGSPAGAEFTVADTGIGIAKEHLPRLWERFYQVDRERSRKAGGYGLGLAIVKDVLARHQAVLEIDSEPGRGSRFTAKFPVHRIVIARAREPERARGGTVAAVLVGSPSAAGNGGRTARAA